MLAPRTELIVDILVFQDQNVQVEGVALMTLSLEQNSALSKYVILALVIELIVDILVFQDQNV